METSTAAATAAAPPAEKGRRPSMQGMRKSCDRCGRNKKGCDGEWPCRRCLGSRKECTYSKRRHPKQQGQRQQRQQTRPAGVHPTKVLLHSTSGAVLAYGMVPFKRCRLSASPGTGLVGMKENVFLSDFFTCVGFLPLTSQSHIREAMVKVMARPSVRPLSGSPHGSWDRGDRFDALTSGGGAFSDTSGALGGGKQLPMDPSTCTFWCAVAMGALVRGSPVESIEHYSQLAGDTLESYSGPVTAELSKASTILAYLHGFMGNREKFEEQLEFSNSILAAFVKQASTDTPTMGIAEMIHHRETAEWCNVDLGEIESFRAPHGPPQIVGATDERESYTSAIQSFRVFEENVYAKAVRMHDSGRSRSDELCKGEEGTASRPGSLYPPRTRPLAETVSRAMVKEMHEENLIQFERLEEAVDRPTIRKGIGSLIISGTLVFNKAAKGDACGTLERISCCVEVYERYLGLCRCMMRTHIAHVLLGALAALGGSSAAELHARLRTTYNRYRPFGSLPVPPLEEWRGISSFCQEFHCRTLECFIMREGLEVFSPPPEREATNFCSAGDEPHDFTEQQQSSTRLVPEGGTEGPVPVPVAAPCSGGAGLEAPADARSMDQHPVQGGRPACSTPSAPPPQRELETTPDTDVVPTWSTPSAPPPPYKLKTTLHTDAIPAWSTRSTPPPKCELGTTPDGDVAPTSRKAVMGPHGKGGPDSFGGRSDEAFVSRGFSEVGGLQCVTGDAGIARPDWLDVTHAMLSAVDDPGAHHTV